MLIQHLGILLALSLSRGYNFEVCAVEPPCTRVEAETGDKALTSWWVVKLGRNQLWKLTYKFVWFLWLLLLRVLCYFGCSCIYVQLWWNMKYVQLLCNMQLEYVTLILFLRFLIWDFTKKDQANSIQTRINKIIARMLYIYNIWMVWF